MKTTSILLFFGFALISHASAFVLETTQKLQPSSTQLCVEKYKGEVSRRGFAESVGIAASFLAFPKPSLADEESAPGGGVSGILQSSNLRSLKRAEKQLSKLEFYAVENEYENMKLALRNAPFSEVRKNSFALIKELNTSPARESKLTASYEVFINAVEKLDSTASLGMRGRKLDKYALLQSYQACSKALGDWIAVATEVAEESS